MITGWGVFILKNKTKVSYGLSPKPFEAEDFFPVTAMGFGSGLKTICHCKMYPLISDQCPPQEHYICTQYVCSQTARAKPKNCVAS